MAKANLEILALSLPLGFRDVFHDDGFVPSIKEHTLKICKKYKLSIIENPQGSFIHPNDAPDNHGRYVCFNGKIRNHHHIFYEDLGFVINLIVRGHEEAEFLREIGKLSLIAKRLLPWTNREIDFQDIRHSEIQCHFGSVYALIRHEIPVEELFRLTKPNYYFQGLRLLLEHYDILNR